MKKLMLLFLLMVGMYSCSDSDTDDLNLITDQNLIENPTFSLKFVRTSRGSTMNNLQVGDSLMKRLPSCLNLEVLFHIKF